MELLLLFIGVLFFSRDALLFVLTRKFATVEEVVTETKVETTTESEVFSFQGEGISDRMILVHAVYTFLEFSVFTAGFYLLEFALVKTFALLCMSYMIIDTLSFIFFVNGKHSWFMVLLRKTYWFYPLKQLTFYGVILLICL